MKRLLLIVAVALALPTAALAKGPSEAVVTGPGIDDNGLVISGLGDDSGLTGLSGFFPATFGQSPDPMLSSPPEETLGQKYRIRYTVPGPSGSDATIVQDVYPYAEPNPVTFTPPGQRFFDTERTRGGWYVSTIGLRNVLVHAGLPAESPVADSGGGDGRTVWPWIVGALALLAVLGCAAWFARARSTSTIRTPSVS
ncbi:MAG TPA: hypothetical protein VGQ15_15385 [Gaiellaceae bacterium]|nr:hypothetical protein [Gaiellaceae bacterium]